VNEIPFAKSREPADESCKSVTKWDAPWHSALALSQTLVELPNLLVIKFFYGKLVKLNEIS